MIKVNYNLRGKEISLSWSDHQTFKEVIGRQTSYFGRTLDSLTDEFLSSKLHDEYLPPLEFILDNVLLPDNPTILDIGSGTSIMDLALYAYLDKKAKFYLLDGKDFVANGGGAKNLHDRNFRAFNKWDPVIDAIETNGFNKDDFTFWSPNWDWDGEGYVFTDKPDSQWKDGDSFKQVDMIISNCSYGLHYPMHVYWEKVLKVLKPGGWLVISPMVNIGDQYEAVCAEFGSPTNLVTTSMSQIKNDRPNDFVRWQELMTDTDNPNAIWGRRAVWQRPL
jgi:SAM-dependent methyltransferase